MEKWVCPSDRQLALRAKLGTGWSVHTTKLQSFTKQQQLSIEEQEQIMSVIQKADVLEQVEQQRIGRLVERVENMTRNAIGNGTTQCILCGDEFGLLGASPTYCDDCRKAVCSKCGVDTVNSKRNPLWLCKICSEKRELWKRSGAWFFKGIPKHVLPSSLPAGGKHRLRASPHGSPASNTGVNGAMNGSPGSARNYNTWNRTGKHAYGGAGGVGTDDGQLSESDSEDELMSRRYQRSSNNTSNRQYLGDSDTISITSSQSITSQTSNQLLLPQATHHATHHDSATESDRDSMGRSRSNSLKSQTESQLGNDDVTKPPPPALDDQDSKSRGGLFHRKKKQKEKKEKEEPTTLLGSIDFHLHYDHVTHQLQVRIVGAQNLKAMDSNGFSDPYVKLHLLPGASKANKLRTKTIPKTLNPEWNETLVYNGITNEDYENKTLRVAVLDEDRFGYDHIGDTLVKLSTLTPLKTHSYSRYLEKHQPEKEEEAEKEDRGKILLALRYVSKRQHLIVGVIKCTGLMAMDTNGYSDPYVKLYLKPDPGKKSKHKTEVKKKTLNPEFNKEFTYPKISVSELASKTLEVTVWDHDLGKTNDYLGGLQLGINAKGERLRHWYDALKKPDETHQKWHNLSAQPMEDP